MLFACFQTQNSIIIQLKSSLQIPIISLFSLPILNCCALATGELYLLSDFIKEINNCFSCYALCMSVAIA